MNIWSEKGAFCHNYTHLQQVVCVCVWGGVCYWNQVVCPSVFRQNGSQTFSVSLITKSHHIIHMVYLLHLGSKGQRSSTLDIEVAIF